MPSVYICENQHHTFLINIFFKLGYEKIEWSDNTTGISSIIRMKDLIKYPQIT